MPTKLEQQADLLFANVNGWETSTLERIGRRINKIGKMSVSDIKSLNNIADVQSDMQAITKELAKVTGMNVRQIEKIYADALTDQHLANKPLYDYRNKVFVPFAENTQLQALAQAYAKSTAGTMINLSKTKMLCVRNEKGQFVKFQKGYYDILDKATMQVASGATDFHSAMRGSIKQMGSGGLRVNYGSGVTRRLDTVVRQNLLWGAKQASIAYNELIGEELGCDGIEIDYHAFPRPSHAFMQGKQYVLGNARKCNGIYFESADEALIRLEDYNCYHYKTPIICGISEPRYDKKELAELKERDKRKFDIDGNQMTGYEASQAMRRIETSVREQKGVKAMAQASGDAQTVRVCNERIGAYKEKYAEISDITGIAQDKKRLTLTRVRNSGTIKETDRNVTFRNMANGLRKPPTYVLSDAEIKTLKDDIRSIGADESVFEFNKGRYTSYNDKTDTIKVRGDVLPDVTSQHPRDLMSSKAVLAHEYYGHRAYQGTKIQLGSWNDEFRASYMAAKNAPNLSDADRRYLVLDAIERAKESGVTIKNNDFIGRVLYGY